jgi:hypothetical protein
MTFWDFLNGAGAWTWVGLFFTLTLVCVTAIFFAGASVARVRARANAGEPIERLAALATKLLDDKMALLKQREQMLQDYANRVTEKKS